MNERGLVEVPENALGDESLAFGLTAVQLGICGMAVLVAAALNLMPLWLPLRLGLALVIAGPIVLAAVLPIHGEPAYRWVRLALRYARAQRTWRAGMAVVDKSEVSEPDENGEPAAIASEEGVQQQVEAIQGTGVEMSSSGDGADAVGAVAAESGDPPMPVSMSQTIVARLRILRPEEEAEPSEPLNLTRVPQEQVPPIPHLLTGLRIVTFLSFAGGVGKSTLAVEAATYAASHARYRTLDGEVRTLRVLLLDASRVTAGAVGLRLGLEPNVQSMAASSVRWRTPSAVEELAVPTRARVDVALAPSHPTTLGPELAPETDRRLFEPDHLDDFLDGAGEAGYQLLIADLGSHLEDGQRHLIDRSDLVIGVIRPTLGSLPDVHRLVAVIRGMGAGRKLLLVANMADDDAVVRTHADEYGLRVAATVPSSPTFLIAEERGEPAWQLDPRLESAVRGVASLAWPLLADDVDADRNVGLLASVRRAAHLRGRAR